MGDTHRFDLTFDGYEDFEKFLDEHEDIIQHFDDGDFIRSLKEHVQWGNQLPEFFEFTPQQYGALAQIDAQALKKLQEDSRVSYTSPDTED